MIENAKSFFVVDVKEASASDKANVHQWQGLGTASQLWRPDLTRSGYLVFTNKNSGKALEITGSSSVSGANVRQGAYSGARGQLWKLSQTGRYSLSGDESLDRIVAGILRTHTTLRSAYDWTVRHSYRSGSRFWSNPHVLPDSTTIAFAKDFFANGSGNCYRFACAFSWLARGLGYRTNVISGWVQATGGGRAPHGWTEVYIGGRTLVCDPDMNAEIWSRNWYLQTYASAPIAYYSW